MPYEEYFRVATESLIIVDRSGQIVEANRKTEELFGYSSKELVGRPVEILLPDKLHTVHRKHVEGFFAAPRTRAMGLGLSLVGRRRDGSEFPVEVSLAFARNTARGDLVVASVTDITQRLALENEARRAETITSLGAIAAGIAHDLNNPLQVIRSRAELLLESDTASPDEIKEDIAAIHRQAQRAARIVEEFLELSRQRVKAIGPVDLNRLVDRALILIGDQMRKVGIQIETELDEELPATVGDATALERVLINLLTNARDAMPQGGSVTISSGQLSDREGWLHLSVADTGPGIEAEKLLKIFDLLYTTKTGGTGLGLWLSRRIVQEHNGRLEVVSEVGTGSTFTMRLPAAAS